MPKRPCSPTSENDSEDLSNSKDLCNENSNTTKKDITHQKQESNMVNGENGNKCPVYENRDAKTENIQMKDKTQRQTSHPKITEPETELNIKPEKIQDLVQTIVEQIVFELPIVNNQLPVDQICK